jgi:hypothetical protein
LIDFYSVNLIVAFPIERLALYWERNRHNLFLVPIKSSPGSEKLLNLNAAGEEPSDHGVEKVGRGNCLVGIIIIFLSALIRAKDYNGDNRGE